MAQDRLDYYFNLHSNDKRKISCHRFISIDPFSIQENKFELSKDFTKWPDISYADIFAYLINFPIPRIYTNKLENMQLP